MILLLMAIFLACVGRGEAAITLRGYADINPLLDRTVTLAGDGLPETANDTTYDYVQFARYPQDSDGGGGYRTQPVVWRVLGVDAGKALLISDRNLDECAFDEQPENLAGDYFGTYYAQGALWKMNFGGGQNNYAYSAIRTFLVGTAQNASLAAGGIFDMYFTEAERGAVSADALTSTGRKDTFDPLESAVLVAGSVTTIDPLFLLSETQAKSDRYFGNGSVLVSNRKAKNTAYAGSRGGYPENRFDYWWLSSPSPNSYAAAYIRDSGALTYLAVDDDGLLLRPALYLELQSFLFKTGSVSGSLLPAGSRQNPFRLYTQWVSASPPTLSIQADGRLKLTFPDLIDAADRFPIPADFTLTTPAGTTITAVDATAGSNFILLEANTPIAQGSHVVLGYVVSADSGGMLTGGAVVAQDTTEAMGSTIWEINRSTGSAGGGGGSGGGTIDPTSLVPVTGIQLDRTCLTLARGDTFGLKATVSPQNATNKKVTWKSCNDAIATVDTNGKVTAVAPGTCVITATTEDGGFTATCLLLVTLTEISIDMSELGLTHGILKLSPGQAIDVMVRGTPSGLKFGADGLPAGMYLTEDGHLYGKISQSGEYPVVLTATASDGTEKTATFTVAVAAGQTANHSSSGGCSSGWSFTTLYAILLFVYAAKKHPES